MNKRVTSLTLEHVEARVAPRKVVAKTIVRAAVPMLAAYAGFLYAMAHASPVVTLALAPILLALALASMASVYGSTVMLDDRSSNVIMLATSASVLVGGSFAFYVFATSAVR